MAQASRPTQGAGVIVDPRFCVTDPVDLVMVRDRTINYKYGEFLITDVNGNMLFQVKKQGFLSGKKILLDGSGSPVLTMKEKLITFHGRWNVFRGESTEDCDLLYTLKNLTIYKFTIKLQVFLGHNNEEKTCDFRVREMNSEQDSCVVYAGESDVIVAQMRFQNHTRQTETSGKDSFSVTVNPNVDYAFIASLLIIFDDFNRTDPG